MSSRCDIIIQAVCSSISSRINSLIPKAVFLDLENISSYMLLQLASVIPINGIPEAVHLVTNPENRMSS